ncbi:MAG: PBP1A family penicillin-binding protein [Firmicutes bacterium]|nr:PBP1A family penicillin-binding protein [Bacillota bacterium]
MIHLRNKKNFPFYLAIFLLLVICGFVISTITMPRDLRLKLENMRFVSKVYDQRGQLIGNLFSHRRIWVPADKISPHLKKAVIAIEDSRYYRHFGIDPIGIARAVYHTLKPGGIKQGGSTITQQLAKISLLTYDRTITRKLQDIFYALLIERTYTKEEILELYLNSINLAHGNIGVEAAARYYFGKSAANLRLEEAALIAGIIRSPENYSPFKHPETARKRRDLVLQKMLEHEFITEAQYKMAVKRDLQLVTQEEAIPVGAYFLDYLREILVKEEGFTEEELLWGGYNIYTTLDLACQQEAERLMKKLPRYSTQIQPEAALVTLDPATGGILAMIGGRDYTTSPLNRSVKAHRQPGSALKPFVYATALENNYTAASFLEDQPVTYLLNNGKEWTPENNDHQFRGKVTLRQALRESVNTIAVQLVDQLGITTVANQLEKMGIHSLVKQGKANDLAYAPLALGGLTKGVTPLELAAAYTSFANQGNYVRPYALNKITNPQGKVIKAYKPAKGIPVISPQTAYIMTMLMQDVIENGTGERARLGDRPAAGKTGTTNNYTNAWFIGYTPEYLTAIWLGNDRQEEPMRYKEGVIGGGTAAQLWGAYMQRITSGHPVREFTEPAGIIWADVDPETGKAVPAWAAKNTYKEVFAEDNVPASPAFKIWHWLTSWPKKGRTKEAPGSVEETPPETGLQPEQNNNGATENSRGQLEQEQGLSEKHLPPLELLNFSY